jgi:dihydroorotase
MTDAILFHAVRAVDGDGQDGVVDVVVEKGLISRIGPGAGTELLGKDRVRTISGKGRILFPGFIDIHAHLREPGQEYKEDIASGLAAAAAGGFVRVCAMPNTRPTNDNRAITEMIVNRARVVRGPRLHPIGAITLGLQGKTLAEFADMREAGIVAVSDDGRCVTDSAVMRHALEYASTFDLPVIQHAEDHALTKDAQMHEGAVATRLGLRGWPRVAEDVIVARDIILAEYTRSRYHVAHISTFGSVALVREAKSRGLKVTCEVTPHHLLMTDSALLGYDTSCKVNPPLREAQDVEALLVALADGTIDCVATDHAPHSTLEKDCEFGEAAHGMTGLELCFPLLFELTQQGKLPLARLIASLTRGPERTLGMAATRLVPGACADLVLYDPEATWTITAQGLLSRSKNTPFLGRTVKGRVLCTAVAGDLVFEREGLS